MLHYAVPQIVNLWNTEVWIPNCKGGTYCINAIEPENFIYSKVIKISSSSWPQVSLTKAPTRITKHNKCLWCRPQFSSILAPGHAVCTILVWWQLLHDYNFALHSCCYLQWHYCSCKCCKDSLYYCKYHTKVSWLVRSCSTCCPVQWLYTAFNDFFLQLTWILNGSERSCIVTNLCKLVLS